jgi:hypothetical protein
MYVTSDSVLVAIDNNNLFLKNSLIIREYNPHPTVTSSDYVDLLTKIASDDSKENDEAKKSAFWIIEAQAFRNPFYLNKTYHQIINDKKTKGSVKKVSPSDVKLIKKSNIYAMKLYDRFYNITYELENQIVREDHRKISTRAAKNFLKNLMYKKH